MAKDDYINYGELIDEAMHAIVKRVLERVEKEGLPGDHHFFISFLTRYPGVKIAQSLLDKYPEEMTIVLQYQFSDLFIEEKGFGVTLSFDNVKEPLYITFNSLTAFADPSVKFGLQFRHLADDEEEGEEEEGNPASAIPTQPAMDADGNPISNVVTLDSFRKK